MSDGKDKGPLERFGEALSKLSKDYGEHKQAVNGRLDAVEQENRNLKSQLAKKANAGSKKPAGQPQSQPQGQGGGSAGSDGGGGEGDGQ